MRFNFQVSIKMWVLLPTGESQYELIFTLIIWLRLLLLDFSDVKCTHSLLFYIVLFGMNSLFSCQNWEVEKLVQLSFMEECLHKLFWNIYEWFILPYAILLLCILFYLYFFLVFNLSSGLVFRKCQLDYIGW